MSLRPTTARFTHVALPCCDLDASIAWYERFTPLRLLQRRRDTDGLSAWMGDPDLVEHPFVIVLVSFFRDQAKGPQPCLGPFAHLGIEMPTREAVDEAAARGLREGCLSWEPRQMPDPIGYLCALSDPDGNVVEFSYDQGVYERARQVWARPEPG
jgi:catechol 2,3-dioxygenase-like lactoylglutathione lyase family enzyme